MVAKSHPPPHPVKKTQLKPIRSRKKKYDFNILLCPNNQLSSLSIGILLFVFLYIVLQHERMTVSEDKPSIAEYNLLQKMYPKTLKCPCSTIVIPNPALFALSPTFHQICHSDFMDDRWMAVLKEVGNDFAPLDWRNAAFSKFLLLRDLCRLANATVKEAIDRFMTQSFIASNVLTKDEFDVQSKTILNEFFQSNKFSFKRLIDIESLIMNVDQSYTESTENFATSFHPDLQGTIVSNEYNRSKTLDVSPAFVIERIL